MKKRLIEFLKYLEIGQDRFAKNVGLSRGYVNNIKDNITMKTVDKILKAYPELSETWLLTGQGEMLNRNHKENLQTESIKDVKNQIQREQPFNEFIAIEKANAERLKKVADNNDILVRSHEALTKSHEVLTKSFEVLTTSHDKLIDLFKESLSVKNNFKIDILIEKLDDFLEHSKLNPAKGVS